MKNNKHIVIATSIALLGSFGCEPENGDQFDVGKRSVVPPTHNAIFVSNNIPGGMDPGERFPVQIVVRNNGSSSPTDDWVGPQYQLLDLTSGLFGFASSPISEPIAVSASSVHTFLITTPETLGSVTFSARMFAGDLFGAQLNRNVNLTQRRRHWQCGFRSSNAPAVMAPGETRNLTVRVQNQARSNAATQTWPAGSMILRSRDDIGPSADYNLWGASSTDIVLASQVNRNANVDIVVPITAPTTPGTYRFLRQMFDSRSLAIHQGIGFFDLDEYCVDLTVAVQDSLTELGANLLSENFPSTMIPGQTVNVRVRMQNSGTESWNNSGNYVLQSFNTPVGLWTTQSDVFTGNPAATNDIENFDFSITAPLLEGEYEHVWRMNKLGGPGGAPGPFGQEVRIPVTVASYNAAVVSQTIPVTMLPGATTNFTVRMRNTGSFAWDDTQFELRSTNTPSNLWTTTAIPLGAGDNIDINQTKTFTFSVTAPLTPGVYESRWQMANSTLAPETFGQEAVRLSVEVTGCGNGTREVSLGEQCDDGNRTDGDGCDRNCLYEPTSTDLAVGPASGLNRTLLGSGIYGQFGTSVASGDVTGDGAQELLIGQLAGLGAGSTPLLASGGAVVGFATGAGFYDGSSVVNPDGSLFQIIGANRGDELGAGALRGIAVADVTDDGTDDLVLSAAKAAGAGGTRTRAGVVYIIQGGDALAAGGRFDLAAPGAWLVKRIEGPSANAELRVLDTGDVNGDGVPDLLLGAPGTTGGGTAYVVAGGAWTGVLDLASLPDARVLSVISGGTTGDGFGRTGAIGNFSGAGASDVLLAAMTTNVGALTRAGLVYGFIAPLGSTLDAGTDADVQWLGGDIYGGLGSSLAIGQVVGTNDVDVVIGGIQLLNPAFTPPDSQRGGIQVWPGPIAPGTTYNLSSITAPYRVFGAEASDRAGASITLGDVNGDGFEDLLVASSVSDGLSNDRPNSGDISVLIGGPSLPTLVDFAANQPPLRLFGSSDYAMLGSRPNQMTVGAFDGVNVGVCLGSALANGNTGQVDCLRLPF